MSPSPLRRAIRAYKRLNQDHFLTERPQRQWSRMRPLRLTESQIVQLVERYRAGATVYELAPEFNIDRRTVSIQLKAAGNQVASPEPDQRADRSDGPAL